MDSIKIALLTDSRFVSPTNPNWYVQNILNDDVLISKSLEKYQIKTVRVDWADPDFDWSTVNAAVFRTTWDYFEKINEFKSWLSRMENTVALYNSLDLVQWNLDKHYLLDLQAKGINIPCTVVKELNETVKLEEFLRESGSEEGIVKPAISGAAWHTYRFSKSNLHEVEALTNTLLKERSMIVQPFQKSVTEFGELSLMVFGGKFTHAVKKVPKQGDFRVQDDHGGKVYLYEATKEEIEFAEKAVSSCSALPTYARVDLVSDNAGKMAVMELELIEPELFFRFNPTAAEVFAKELAKQITLRA